MVDVTLNLDVSLPETTSVETPEEAVDEAYEIIDSAPAFDGIDAEELPRHVTDTEVDGADTEE